MPDPQILPPSHFVQRSDDGTTVGFILPANVRVIDGIELPTFKANTSRFDAPNEPGSLRSMSVDDAVQAGQRVGHIVKDLLDTS